MCILCFPYLVRGHTPAFMGSRESRKKRNGGFLSLICVVEPSMDEGEEKQEPEGASGKKILCLIEDAEQQ